MRNGFSKLLIVIVFCCCCCGNSFAYSVLAHEAVIDAAWDSAILPVLKSKFPKATDAQLREARAYAYGGSVVPDMGGYPQGSRLFSHLLHYVRTGDFIEALFEAATDVNEYAFALGVLSHYYGDAYGQSLGTNLAAPVIFKKIKKRYGDTVTYAMHRMSHIRTEYSFDVLQLSRIGYSQQAYRDFVGFKVAESLLAKAFMATYNVDINSIHKDYHKTVSKFRWGVTDWFPYLTRLSWKGKKGEIRRTRSQMTKQNYVYHLHKAGYSEDDAHRPSFGTRALVAVVRVLPKYWLLRELNIEKPGPVAEQLFVSSFDTVVSKYIAVVKATNKTARFANLDFDTGKETCIGEYPLADNAYAALLLRLKANGFKNVSPQLREHMLGFYSKNDDKISPACKGQIAVAVEELKAIKNR
jgi:hypothetical protein